MKRATLAMLLSALALALGIATARLAAENRARGDDLDRRHQNSDTLERQNELLRVENERVEWSILHGDSAGSEPADGGSASDTTDPTAVGATRVAN